MPRRKQPKKVLTPEEERELGPAIAEAEKMAAAGFGPQTTAVQQNNKFDLAADIQAQNAAFSGQMPVEQMQQQAMQAVQQTQPEPQSQPEPQPAQAQPVEEQPAEEAPEEDVPSDPTARLAWFAEKIHQFNPNAPNKEVLGQWKQMHGGVYVLQISDFLFIFRYLKRQEWLQILAKPDWDNLSEDQQNDHLVDRCLLWPRYDQFQKAGLPGGAIPMLADQIKMESLFLNPQVVSSMTFKL